MTSLSLTTRTPAELAVDALVVGSVSTPDGAEHRLARLLSPGLLGGMDRAVSVLMEAIAGDKRIVVAGDYDCDGATGTATVNLRGLGSSRTLVLVNGRRLMPGDPTDPVADINFIPSALIKRGYSVNAGRKLALLVSAILVTPIVFASSVSSLIAAVAIIGLAAAARTPGDGLVALQLAGTITTVAMLLMAVGLGREPLGDLALVLAVGSFIGSLAYATILGRSS